MHFKQYRNHRFPTEMTDRLSPTDKENQTKCYALISIPQALNFIEGVNVGKCLVRITLCSEFAAIGKQTCNYFTQL